MRYLRNGEPVIALHLCESEGGISAMISAMPIASIRAIRDWCNFILREDSNAK